MTRRERLGIFGIISVRMLTPFLAQGLAAASLAGPVISLDSYFAMNVLPVGPGGSWSQMVTVINTGDSPLTIRKIGTSEEVFFGYGPRGWLSTSENSLYVLPGSENSVQFDIRVELSAYEVLYNLDGEVYLLSDSGGGDSTSVTVFTYMSQPDTAIRWGLVYTDLEMYSEYSNPDKICVGLLASSSGALGLPGWRGAHLDYAESALECGGRDADQVYLNSGSPFVLLDDGDSVSLTVSNFQTGSVEIHHWQSTVDPPAMYVGTEGGYGSFEWLRTDVMQNRDGRIGMRRELYAPYTPDGHTVYILVRTTLFSADGLPHNHVTFGSAIDWDIPSDEVAINTGGTGIVLDYDNPCEFVFLQGTDTVGSTACQSNTRRFGAEVFLFGARRGSQQSALETSNDSMPWGAFAAPQALMRDTNLTRLGLPIYPSAPEGQAWWDEIASHPGFHAEPVAANQAIWTTYMHDTHIDAQDTMEFWSVLTTVRDGTLDDLEAQVAASDMFISLRLSECCACCAGHVGDANGSGQDEPTIGDVATIIDALFISVWGDQTIPCVDEADFNNSGGCCSNFQDVTIGDIAMLIDYLFITGPGNMELPPCDWY